MLERISTENVCDILQFSKVYRLVELEKHCWRYLCSRLADIAEQEEVVSLSQSDILQLLRTTDLGPQVTILVRDRTSTTNMMRTDFVFVR